MVGTYTPIEVTEPWVPSTPPPAPPTTWQKFSHKFKEEPLVPIGILATVIALGGATRHLQQGNRTQFNKWLRYRVAAQGVTVIAALGGSVYYARDRRLKREAERAAAKADAAATVVSA